MLWNWVNSKRQTIFTENIQVFDSFFILTKFFFKLYWAEKDILALLFSAPLHLFVYRCAPLPMGILFQKHPPQKAGTVDFGYPCGPAPLDGLLSSVQASARLRLWFRETSSFTENWR